MNGKLKLLLGTSVFLIAMQATAAQITFYEGEGFRGRVFSTERPVANLSSVGFNDRASSVVVDSGRWEVCEDSRYGGRCTLLRRGSYDSLESLGIDNRISSVRPINGARRDYEAREPLEEPTYEYRRRPDERLYEARVLSVRAVVGPPEQRCWLEREQVIERGRPNVGGAIAGAIIGGVLGHQIGGGSGRDIATAGGAVVGGAVGANAGRGSGGAYERDVQHCENVADRTPDYWDVTYDYQGVE